MKKIWLILSFIVLAACQPATPDPAAIQTAVAQTQSAQPSPTTAASSTPTPTATPQPTQLPTPSPIVYYYFVDVESKPLPAGSVVILPDILILAPTLSDIARGPDTAANLRSALQAVLADSRNAWTSSDLDITSITFSQGAADVVLQGKIFAPGDIVLIAARMQLLLTVFAEAPVQTAAITINGKNIANLGISMERDAKPDDYAYTRAEIEAFLAENAYRAP